MGREALAAQITTGESRDGERRVDRPCSSMGEGGEGRLEALQLLRPSVHHQGEGLRGYF